MYFQTYSETVVVRLHKLLIIAMKLIFMGREIVWCWTIVSFVYELRLKIFVSLANPWEYTSSMGEPKTPKN